MAPFATKWDDRRELGRGASLDEEAAFWKRILFAVCADGYVVSR